MGELTERAPGLFPSVKYFLGEEGLVPNLIFRLLKYSFVFFPAESLLKFSTLRYMYKLKVER